MADVNDEVAALFEKYTGQMVAIAEAFRVELTAVAWRVAAEIVAKNLTAKIAVGRLDWDGKETKLAIPAPDKPKVIKGRGKIPAAGSKPQIRTDQYRELLDQKTGTWSRRGSTKVTYVCVGWKGMPRGMSPFVYLMKNEKTGKTINVKFESIVRDWTCRR